MDSFVFKKVDVQKRVYSVLGRMKKNRCCKTFSNGRCAMKNYL